MIQESFYSKLKTFADEQNTNLYVSNLPKTMNEHALGNLFAEVVAKSTESGFAIAACTLFVCRCISPGFE